MWIEIPDEIEEYLNKIHEPLNKSVVAINTLIESMLKGHHIVYASRKLLNSISKLDYISPTNKRFITWVIQKYIYIYSAREIVDYKIIVTIREKEVKKENNTYFVPLLFFYDFRETKLLTEHETDCEFYIYIYEFIKKEKNTCDLLGIKFENDSCHGSNVCSKISQNAKDNRISICILVSDKDMERSKYGDTYKGAHKIYNKIEKNHIFLLKALACREKENLFSPNIYEPFNVEHEKFFSVLSNFIEDEKIIKYFDIKDGVKYKKYRVKGWEEYYRQVINQMIDAGIYTLPDSKSESMDDFVCVKGIGDKLCFLVCKAIMCDKQIADKIIKDIGLNETQRQKVQNIRLNLRSVLPPYIYSEWMQLYKILFSWGCCISEKKLPNYEM